MGAKLPLMGKRLGKADGPIITACYVYPEIMKVISFRRTENYFKCIKHWSINKQHIYEWEILSISMGPSLD